MAYDAPEYSYLKTETERLQQSFARLTKRYIAPCYQSLREKFLKLEDLYKKKLKEKEKQRWTKCLPDKTRLEQIACISQLANNMPSNQTARNEEVVKKAQAILIGSGLYRYTRIDNSYKFLFGFFGDAQDNSALNMALGEVLGLSEENKMDPLTWADCCTAYLDYLKENDNYASYSYVNNDPYFFPNLDWMIRREQEKAQPMIKLSQYILFIQSVLKMLDGYSAEVLQLTGKLKEVLESQSSTVRQVLNKKEILELLLTCEPKMSLYNLCARILPEDYNIAVEDSQVVVFDGQNAKGFQADVHQRITTYCQYALLAAYILVLTRINELQQLVTVYSEKMLMEELKKALKFAIGEQDSNKLDNETRDLALTSLQLFVDLGQVDLIKTEAWEGMELFKRELHRQLVNVRHPSIEPESRVAFTI
ncbi:Uncharacterised protein [Legionella beliardensis]|uniref:Dot/Icm secretion system substrate n=1 Tax=Legionella beliardensis TaxID=91822 RepID=A0A378I2I8_9GAMM|nr:hypothetical protein [Legionella beliardensis]STX29378.1 Uncharacterised protein [Legionella beliardensis]